MQPLIDSDHKKCRVCGEIKELKDFHFNKSCTKGVTGTCRECNHKRVKAWYAENLEQRSSSARDRCQDRKDEAIAHFGDKCTDCKGTYPRYVYQFHHLDPSKKDVNPSAALRRTPERMWEELKKCVMLCANCHMIRHHSGKEYDNAASGGQ